MYILGIETSCDETSASVIKATLVEKSVKVLSNVVSSSMAIHAATGGIIPENAAREQVKFIIPVVRSALEEAKISINNIDEIAVTYGPGLIGSLLVGVETAKTLSYVFNKKIVGVNHMLGHIYANFIEQEDASLPEFPAIALIVSGGHTDLLYIKKHNSFEFVGGTRDDAAGEALDKVGRLLDLDYPAGPTIENLAKTGNQKRFNFPRPLFSENNFDFSFSGLKTAVFRQINEMNLNDQDKKDICFGVQKAIIDVLVKKTLNAAQKYNVNSVMISGGVAANTALKENFQSQIEYLNLDINFHVPTKSLCTDNAAMIASAAFYGNIIKSDWKNLTVNPSLYFQ